jgi:hypothetical protein
MISFIDEHFSRLGVEPNFRLLPIGPSTHYEVIAKRTDVDRLSVRARSDIAMKIAIGRVFKSRLMEGPPETPGPRHRGRSPDGQSGWSGSQRCGEEGPDHKSHLDEPLPVGNGCEIGKPQMFGGEAKNWRVPVERTRGRLVAGRRASHEAPSPA